MVMVVTSNVSGIRQCNQLLTTEDSKPKFAETLGSSGPFSESTYTLS